MNVEEIITEKQTVKSFTGLNETNIFTEQLNINNINSFKVKIAFFRIKINYF